MGSSIKKNVIAPIATGNGAFVAHKNLELKLRGYEVLPYHPYLTLLPAMLFPIGRKLTPKIIHTTPDYAFFHARRNVPLVVTFHGYVVDGGLQDYCGFFKNLHYKTDLKWLVKKSILLADQITAVSHFTASLASSDLQIKKPVRVIYNGVDERIFSPSSGLRKGFGHIKVLFSGNLKATKGSNWLVPILNKLNKNISIRYTSGLSGPCALPSHPRLENIGVVGYKDMPDLYKTSDILLFPTVREGFGLAAVEAMACGLPVVATNCSSLPELIDHGKGGFLCELGDVDDFADKINLLADNAKLRKEMGEYNRGRVEQHFTLDQMVFNYRQLFDEVAQKG